MSKMGAGKSPGGRPVEDDGAAATGESDGLTEGLRVNGGDQHAVYPAGGLLHLGDQVGGAGVDGDLGAQAGGQGELESSMSTATTRSPMARAYCTAMWPRPPMPEIATHCPAGCRSP